MVFPRAVAAVLILLPVCARGGEGFVTRSGDRLTVRGSPVYLLGANAYSLRERSARGDTAAVRRICADAAAQGMTWIRTWAFFDSPDSANPSVIQYRPGKFNEHALQALDYVIVQARQFGLRLLLPLVNSWDDYGGMNQYVRWRAEIGAATPAERRQTGPAGIVTGPHGRTYSLATEAGFGHDDFYTDSTIQSWYMAYAQMLLQRTNTLTGIPYREDTTILGWELANEPRSSDPSGLLVMHWIARMATVLKSVDPNHLVGTGEEGFDATSQPYPSLMYSGHEWLVNGNEGVSFSLNTGIYNIDFASIHLYPEAWGILNSRGTTWIDAHLRIAAAAAKPLLLGEFGVTSEKATTYESWLTTVLLDGGAGAAVWELLDSSDVDPEGFGIHCPGDDQTCSVLESAAREFGTKTSSGSLPLPAGLTLLQNYPNPFNRVTVISYTLPSSAHVRLSLYNMVGQRVMTLVDADQRRGRRKELLDGALLASGAYMYRLTIVPVEGGGEWEMSGKMILLK